MSKVIITRIIKGSDTFGGYVPPARPTPKCPHCGKPLPTTLTDKERGDG